MAWLAVDQDGAEYIYSAKPIKIGTVWSSEDGGYFENISQGSIELLFKKTLTWEDEPVEI